MMRLEDRERERESYGETVAGKQDKDRKGLDNAIHTYRGHTVVYAHSKFMESLHARGL